MLLLLLLTVGTGSHATARPAGWVVGWGNNIPGQVTGVPSTGHSTGCVTIAGQILTNAVAVAAGIFHGLAIRSDGTVVGWGLNARGQATGVASAPGYFGAGVVTIDGQVLSNVVAIAAGWVYSQALRSDGTIAAWGTHFNGDNIRVPSELRNVVSIAGWHNFVAAKSDGTVVAWGDDSIIRRVNGLSNIVAVSSPLGPGPFLALQNDGTVFRARDRGILSAMDIITSNATAIAAGSWQSLALKTDGTIFGWRSDKSVPLGLTNVVAVAAGDSHCLALKQDGTVVAWGRVGLKPATVPAGLSNVVAIAAGNNFSLAITTNPVVAERFRR